MLVNPHLESSDRVKAWHSSYFYRVWWKRVWCTHVPMRCIHIPTIVMLAHVWAKMANAAVLCLREGGILVHTPLRNTHRAEARPCHISIRYGKEYETPLCQWGVTILIWLSFCPFLSWNGQCGSMVPWGGIVIHNTLGQSERVKAGPCYLSLEYRKEYEIPL